jgi:sulfate transport system substrate-binding protein
MIASTLRAAVAALALGAAAPAAAQSTTLLNASYDIARELFADINPVFVEAWRAETGQDVTVDQSHGGTSRQARAIMEGLQADVVTFNQTTDIDILVERGGLVAADWRERLPHAASPWYSLPAFLVRAGNPKNIRDWDDLARDDVAPVFPNPKTSGNARYTYLAAYAYALDKFGGDETQAQEFVAKIFAGVPVFDTGGRAATTTFVEREIGDVLITFEAETFGVAAEYPEGGYEVVVPSSSLLAEFPVAVVDRVVDARGTREVAEGYLRHLYSPEVQRIAAERFYRVRDESVAEEFADRFPELRLFTVDEVFGGWDAINERHLAEGAILDQVFVNR